MKSEGVGLINSMCN